jgi:hypothetical protein
MPIKPSGGNWEISKPVEYWFAAPSVWPVAYGKTCERFSGKEKKNVARRTTRPAMTTSSVYCSPLTVEPSPYASEKVFPRSCDVELEDGSYSLWPEQVDPQLDEGTKRSLLPVSKSTVYNTRSDGNI